jgi:NADH-quinone oxidoreductase subunit J
MIPYITFHIFGLILVVSALLVITARNPVHSVLFLILGFFNAAGLFVLLGAEFVAFILAIVYVGAVAVLFLFVVMMLDINFADLRKGAMQYIPIGLLIGAVLFIELFFLAMSWETSPAAQEQMVNKVSADIGNTESLGQIIYTNYFLIFQMSGMVLLVAMIGAIVLTLRERPGVRRQKVARQTQITREEVVEVQKVTPRTGV